MQTFFLFPYYEWTCSWLDFKRLNKQVIEAYQILTGRVPNTNHPACLMWRGYENHLRRYALACCREYAKRVGKEHSLHSVIAEMAFFPTKAPTWNSCPILIYSHRVNLLRKNFQHYRPLAMLLPYEDLDAYPGGYFWPVTPVGQKARKDRENWLSWYENYIDTEWIKA